MTIPLFQQTMLPFLRLLADKREHSLREVIDSLASEFKLGPDDLRERLPSGRQAIFDNRVGWARTYLKKAGLIKSTQRGFFRITPRGVEVLRQKPAKIDLEFLDQFEEFRAFVPFRRR